MKIICIEGNYNDSKENFQHPLFSIKPETCILRNNHPYFIPDHSENISPRIHIVLKVSRLGKNIQEKFAHLYYQEIGIGMDMIPIDTLDMCKKNRLPWDTAKCYDFSSPLGSFIPKNSFTKMNDIPFILKINDQEIIKSNTANIVFHFDSIIEHVSKYVILKMGDLIYTGSPLCNYGVKINERVECFISNKKLLWFNVK